MENEIWKAVVGYEGFYEVSNQGRVKSLKRKVNNRTNEVPERILKQSVTNNGYFKIVLNNQKPQTCLVHRLVASSFLPNLENKKCINHIDCNRLNNSVDNIEWATHSENNSYSFRMGRRVTNLITKKGTDSPNAKLSQRDVDFIRANYRPYKLSVSKLATLYAVHPATIENVLKYKTYKDA